MITEERLLELLDIAAKADLADATAGLRPQGVLRFARLVEKEAPLHAKSTIAKPVPPIDLAMVHEALLTAAYLIDISGGQSGRVRANSLTQAVGHIAIARKAIEAVTHTTLYKNDSIDMRNGPERLCPHPSWANKRLTTGDGTPVDYCTLCKRNQLA